MLAVEESSGSSFISLPRKGGVLIRLANVRRVRRVTNMWYVGAEGEQLPPPGKCLRPVANQHEVQQPGNVLCQNNAPVVGHIELQIRA